MREDYLVIIFLTIYSGADFKQARTPVCWHPGEYAGNYPSQVQPVLFLIDRPPPSQMGKGQKMGALMMFSVISLDRNLLIGRSAQEAHKALFNS